MSRYSSFQKFTSQAEADEMVQVLNANGVHATVEKDQEVLDKNFVGTQYDVYYRVMLPATDFDRAWQVLITTSHINLDDVPADYELLSFSKDELLEVLAKPDEWGAYNYNIAIALLRKQNIDIDMAKVEAIKQAHIAEIAAERGLSGSWYAGGYVFSVLAIFCYLMGMSRTYYWLYSFYFLPGSLGIILGIYIRFVRKTLPDGKRMFSFSSKARTHGLVMIVLGIVALLPLMPPFANMVREFWGIRP